MTPGIINGALDLKPMKRISPSRYLGLKQCPLREVWTAADQRELLPSSPAARLGTIIHQLLRDAGSGHFGSAERSIVDRRWEDLVNEAENEMRTAWLEQQFIPLRTSVPDFEVRRLRAQERALVISRQVAQLRPGGGDKTLVGFERWVATADGAVGGLIDQVVHTDAGSVLRDYKSGSIRGASAESADAVKGAFVEQLRLYAALYAAVTGRWPVRLEVVPLSGDAISIPFDPDECVALLEDAVASMRKINATLAEYGRKEDATERLANPSGAVCRQCSFRPACEPYWRARVSQMDDAGWPIDVRGELRDVQQLGNGKVFLSIGATSGEAKLQYVRGLMPGPARHPALQYLKRGDRIGVYNLKRSTAEGTMTETDWTVLYKTQLGPDAPPP